MEDGKTRRTAARRSDSSLVLAGLGTSTIHVFVGSIYYLTSSLLASLLQHIKHFLWSIPPFAEQRASDCFQAVALLSWAYIKANRDHFNAAFPRPRGPSCKPVRSRQVHKMCHLVAPA